MIDIYVWTTPNGRKPLILLEELGIPYEVHAVDLTKGAQKDPAFLAVNPNGKIPAAIFDRGTDREVRIFESGAILLYLADRERRFVAAEGQARADALSWLMFQMGGVGPMFGQLGHFAGREEKIHYAIERYRSESERLLGVLDGRLGSVPYLAGDYSIADMATYPWVAPIARFGFEPSHWPNVKKWIDRVGERPAVKKAMEMKL